MIAATTLRSLNDTGDATIEIVRQKLDPKSNFWAPQLQALSTMGELARPAVPFLPKALKTLTVTCASTSRRSSEESLPISTLGRRETPFRASWTSHLWRQGWLKMPRAGSTQFFCSFRKREGIR